MKPVTNKLFDQIDFFNEILNKKNHFLSLSGGSFIKIKDEDGNEKTFHLDEMKDLCKDLCEYKFEDFKKAENLQFYKRFLHNESDKYIYYKDFFERSEKLFNKVEILTKREEVLYKNSSYITRLFIYIFSRSYVSKNDSINFCKKSLAEKKIQLQNASENCKTFEKYNKIADKIKKIASTEAALFSSILVGNILAAPLKASLVTLLKVHTNVPLILTGAMLAGLENYFDLSTKISTYLNNLQKMHA